MHEIVNELKKICALIPFSKERAAYQGSSAVFPVGNYIGKIKFGIPSEQHRQDGSVRNRYRMEIKGQQR